MTCRACKCTADHAHFARGDSERCVACLLCSGFVSESAPFYSYNSGTPQCETYLILHPEFDPAAWDPIPLGSYCALDGTPITGPEQAKAELAFGPVVRDSGWAF